MRSFEFLSEASLTKAELQKHNGKYLNNLLTLIRNGAPIDVTPDAQQYLGATVIIDPASIDNFLRTLENPLIKNPTFKIKDSGDDDFHRVIHLNRIQKTAAIKGKGLDYNVGDIGEIALGIAAATRFLVAGDEINAVDFINMANQFKLEHSFGKKGQLLDSLKLTFEGDIRHFNGKIDRQFVTVLAPSRSVKEFQKFIADPGGVPDEIKGTILSAIQYANNSEKITNGIIKTAKDPKTNKIEILCDGVSDQKGTKADLTMVIDGKKLHLLSAKTGPSQLGQASGHEWEKQEKFFKTVFDVDVSSYKKQWGNTNEEHISALKSVWSTLIIPRVQALTGGDSVAKEVKLVKSISNGLIRYSNNYDDTTGNIDTVDIVQLSTNFGTPGYSLLRIDNKLTKALEQADLYGESTPNGQGIAVFGEVEGRRYLLFKARSYYSAAGKVTRTIIEGGPLLEKLATLDKPYRIPLPKTQKKRTPAVQPQSQQQQLPLQQPANEPVVQPQNTTQDELDSIKKNAGLQTVS